MLMSKLNLDSPSLGLPSQVSLDCVELTIKADGHTILMDTFKERENVGWGNGLLAKQQDFTGQEALWCHSLRAEDSGGWLCCCTSVWVAFDM